MADIVQTGWRIIFDLSSPNNRSVNDGIPTQYRSIVYETLNNAIRLVAQAGRGAVIMKRDLKSAFHDHFTVVQAIHKAIRFVLSKRSFLLLQSSTSRSSYSG